MARKSRRDIAEHKPTRVRIWRVAIYIRLSREDSRIYDESESVKNQRMIIERHIASFSDGDEYIIVREYVDDGISGTTDDERDSFQKMLTDIKNGQINCVIVKDLARSFRNFSLCAWLAAVGASVCYVEENESNILTTMAAAYEMEPMGEGWRMDGVQYGTKPPAEPVNFIIHDLGCQPVLNEKVYDAGLLVIVCGTKTYELPNSMRQFCKAIFIRCCFWTTSLNLRTT